MDRPLPRRTVVRGAGALGIASFALPPAAAHATALEPQAAVDLTGMPYLASFLLDNTTTTTFPVAQDPDDTPAGSGVTGTFDYRGMTPDDDGRTWWTLNNASTFPDIFGGGSYWEFTLSTGAKAVNPSALYLNHVFSAFHTIAVRSDVNGYATNLRLLTPRIQSNRVIVNLTGLGTLAPNDSLTIRCFFYGNTNGGTDFPGLTGSPGTPYDETLDATTVSIEGRNAAFFGDVIEP